MKTRNRKRKTRKTRNRKTRKGGEVDIAQQYIDEAAGYEKSITPLLLKVVNEFNSADPISDQTRLEGLAYNIKSRESLRSKLAQKKPYDVLRYTFIVPESNFADNIVSIDHYLEIEGIQKDESRSKNYFCDKNIYKGINRTYIFNNFLFEIQFHTDASYDAKTNKTHALYETFRQKCSQPECTVEEKTTKCELAKKMIAINDAITTTYPPEPCKVMKTYCE